MNQRNILSDEYPGDAAWRRFVTAFCGAFEVRQDQSACLAGISDQEIAVVLAARMGAQGINWMQDPCRALDDKTPREVLESGESGKKAVRTLLMRMP